MHRCRQMPTDADRCTFATAAHLLMSPDTFFADVSHFVTLKKRSSITFCQILPFSAVSAPIFAKAYSYFLKFNIFLCPQPCSSSSFNTKQMFRIFATRSGDLLAAAGLAGPQLRHGEVARPGREGDAHDLGRARGSVQRAPCCVVACEVNEL